MSSPILPDVDALVIGAGVVGLAVARALAKEGRDVVVLEQETGIGQHTSSRNSEVLHAGIYYRPGSLKARLCVEGQTRLYAYCAEEGIPHQRVGKLIVATRDEEIPALERLRAQAMQNGVERMDWMSAAEAIALEPRLHCVRALHSPATGIVDSGALMLRLRRDAEKAGAALALETPMVAGTVCDHGIQIVTGGAQPSTITARVVVNAAGLFAPQVAGRIAGIPRPVTPVAYFAKGHYAGHTGKTPFSRLVYPVPVPGGLGTHFTLDLAGQGRFGPDVAWVDKVDYAFDESRLATFIAAIHRYLPDFPDDALTPAYCGIRPKITAPGTPDADFVIQGPDVHGAPGLVNLFGIESPGLTACLVIADEVSQLLKTN